MTKNKPIAQLPLLSFAFFLSGGAGLIYQVAWQRILFSAFGIDLVSVTVIVSAFMLGLGIGAIAGGQIVDRHPQHALLLFALSEATIGIFGFSSPAVLHWASDAFFDQSYLVIGIVNFLLVLIPTSLMGATLPILIVHLTRTWGNVGQSTGWLYSVNTIGAMVGALVTSFILFNYIGLNAVIYIAASINILVAASVYFLLSGRK